MFSRTSITAVGSDRTATPGTATTTSASTICTTTRFWAFCTCQCFVYHLLVECTLRSISELSLVVVVIVVF